VVIGVAWPFAGKDLFNEGIALARDEIVAAGGVLGRPLELVERDDGGSMPSAMRVAQHFSEDTRVMAVIGHRDSRITLATSVAYQYHGLLMLSPASTSARLTERGLTRVFSSVPRDTRFAQALVAHARREGLRRIVILFSKSDYGRSLSNAFELAAMRQGVSVIHRKSYHREDDLNLQALFKRWREYYQFDAILLAGRLPVAGELLQKIRQAGLTQPVLAGHELDNAWLFQVAGKAAEGTVVATVFSPDASRGGTPGFVARFRKKYGRAPDLWAAQAYDSLKLLAHAIEVAGTTRPDRVAAALRSGESWAGITGDYSFSEEGQVVGAAVFCRRAVGGRFVAIEK